MLRVVVQHTSFSKQSGYFQKQLGFWFKDCSIPASNIFFARSALMQRIAFKMLSLFPGVRFTNWVAPRVRVHLERDSKTPTVSLPKCVEYSKSVVSPNVNV